MNDTKSATTAKKKIFTKKRVFTAAALIILAAAVTAVSVSIYAQKQTEKIPAMSAKDCLSYTLQDNEQAVITIGTIKNGERNCIVYGKDCIELDYKTHKNHIYEIGSLTKTITAAMTAKAVQEGLLGIDETIDRYLDLPKDNSYPSVRELLTHTSGYKEYYFESPMIGNFFSGRNSFCGITDDMILNRLGSISTENTDKSWRYSNFGFAVLGLLLEKVYDSEYDVLADTFLSELGMTASHISTGDGDLKNYWDWKAGDSYMPAGAVVSDMEDMLLYAQKQLDGEGVFALAHDTLKEVNATPDSCALLDMRVDAMGMGWIIDEEHGFIWHNGATGNYNSYLGFCPETQTAVVILSNLSPGYRIPATVAGIKLLEEIQPGSDQPY